VVVLSLRFTGASAYHTSMSLHLDKFCAIILCTIGLTVFGLAQQTPRIACVNMVKVFDNYWRTKQAEASLKDQAAELEREHKELVDQWNKAKVEYQKLVDSAADPAISSEERERRKTEAERKLNEVREIEKTVAQHERQARITLEEKQRRLRANLVDEIRATITAVAQSGGYTIVLDSSAVGVNNVPIVLYNSPAVDISEEVLRQLNATAPPGFIMQPTSTNQAPPAPNAPTRQR